MKYAFVRFVEHHEEDGGDRTCFAMAMDCAAESREAFIEWYYVGVRITITGWFEVPEEWRSAVSEGLVNGAFEALIGLEGLNEDQNPIVSDLFITIFAAGFMSGETHHLDVQAAGATSGK